MNQIIIFISISAFKTQLDSLLTRDASNNFTRLLNFFCNTIRDESGYADINEARADATELFLAGKTKFDMEKSTFNRILSQRSYQQLKLIFEEYRNVAGQHLEKSLKNQFSKDVEVGIKSILRCIDSKEEFFALQINKNISQLGKNDCQLIRILVTRCEIDLKLIKESYERMFGKSLESIIEQVRYFFFVVNLSYLI